MKVNIIFHIKDAEKQQKSINLLKLLSKDSNSRDESKQEEEKIFEDDRTILLIA